MGEGGKSALLLVVVVASNSIQWVHVLYRNFTLEMQDRGLA